MIKKIACPFLLFLLALLSCERKPYVEHKVKLEKQNGDCKGLESGFRMNSNFGGERFEFSKCLPVDFKDEWLISERHGDTVLIKFTNIDAPKKSTFNITLDIDSYPKYSYITIDDETYSIVPTDK